MAGDDRVETTENRLRRLRLRSWHRGIREMDLILGRFADERLAGLSPELLDAFDLLLSENDHDLYRWVGGSAEGPARYAEIISGIRAFHRIG